jgi:chromosome segregation and condensation protein ScpB
VLEAALLVAGEPVPVAQLARSSTRLADATRAQAARRAQGELDGRKVELVQVASGWRFQGGPKSNRISTGSRRKSRRAIRAR